MVTMFSRFTIHFMVTITNTSLAVSRYYLVWIWHPHSWKGVCMGASTKELIPSIKSIFWFNRFSKRIKPEVMPE